MSRPSPAEADVLFDAPGPRARRRHRILAAVGALLLTALTLLLLRGLAAPDNNQLAAAKWRPFLQASSWADYLLPGLLSTLQAAGLSIILGIGLGITLGLGRLSPLTAVRLACGAFVEFFRAVPVLLMMFFAYYFGLFTLHLTGGALPLFAAVVGITLYNASVIAELVRSGVQALPRGQREAGQAIGLSSYQTLTAVLLPQAITNMLPSLISQLVVTLKDSALAYNVAYLELLRQGQNLASYKGNLIPTLIVLAALYIVINSALTTAASAVERRLRRSRRGSKIRSANGITPPAYAPAPQLSHRK